MAGMHLASVTHRALLPASLGRDACDTIGVLFSQQQLLLWTALTRAETGRTHPQRTALDSDTTQTTISTRERAW